MGAGAAAFDDAQARGEPMRLGEDGKRFAEIVGQSLVDTAAMVADQIGRAHV